MLRIGRGESARGQTPRRAVVSEVGGGLRPGSGRRHQGVVGPASVEQRVAGLRCALGGGERRVAKVQSGVGAAV
jgi:hypothetical protein